MSKSRLQVFAWQLVIAGALLVLLEFTVRLAFPGINNQGTDSNLFQPDTSGASLEWRPHAEGMAFGEQVVIDQHGYRSTAAPDASAVGWLLLGDSVTFGVGVPADQTFAGLIQQAVPDIMVWNTGVVGYSVENYRAVLNRFLDSGRPIRKVLLFFTLNDLYAQPNIDSSSTWTGRTLAFLRRNSKLYMLAKNLLFDRSKSYFQYDYEQFAGTNPRLPATLGMLGEINADLHSRGIDFLVILLPYEYQVRRQNPADLKPQQILSEFMLADGIPFVDAYDYFVDRKLDSQELYLYADAMHLSAAGHKVVYRMLRSAGVLETN